MVPAFQAWIHLKIIDPEGLVPGEPTFFNLTLISIHFPPESFNGVFF